MFAPKEPEKQNKHCFSFMEARIGHGEDSELMFPWFVFDRIQIILSRCQQDTA